MASASEFGSWRHLSRRFFTALSPLGPRPEDEEWAQAQLLDGERALWQRMSGPDRRHAVGVARDTIRRLGPERASRDVVAAALLHDVGKVEASLGTLSRVGVTLAAVVVGRSRLTRWAERTGAVQPDGVRHPWRARAGLYLGHDRLGARLLERAGSEAVTVAWAAEHHIPSDQWSLDARTGEALKAADDD